MSNPQANRTIKRFRLRRIVVALGAFVVGVLLVLMLLENSLIYHPRREARGTWTPPTLGGEDAEFASADGTRLVGWYLPHPEPRAVVLFACGNGGNMSYWRDEFRMLVEQCGISLMGFDYRGYGRSDGSPHEAGVLSDARAARAWLARRAGVAERDVVLMGRSLGGGVAIDLATDGARGLVVESTFTQLPDVAARVFPYLPVRWLMRTRFDSIGKIRGYQSPLFVSHGDSDGLVPFEMGRSLFDAAASSSKKFYTVVGGDHNDPQPDDYYDLLTAFFAALPR